MGETIAKVQSYPFATLRGQPVRARLRHMGNAGTITCWQLELAPLRLLFAPNRMANNVDEGGAIARAVQEAAGTTADPPGQSSTG